MAVDFTAPTASAASNDTTHGRKEPGQAAKAAELRKIAHTDHAMHALRNAMEFVPAALEKDTCHVGQGLHTLLTRITSAREGETFEPNDMPNQYGFKEGTWNTPTAYRFWLAVLLVQNVLRRELQIDNVYRQNPQVLRIHHWTGTPILKAMGTCLRGAPSPKNVQNRKKKKERGFE